MKVNSINNNYNNQKQQNFGAIAGKNFEEGLVSLLTHLRPNVLKETLTLLNNPKAVSEFAAEFNDIKLARTGYHGVISPVVDIFKVWNIHGINVEVPASKDLGRNTIASELQLQPSSNLFNIIIKRVKMAVSGHKLCPREPHEPSAEVQTNKSIRESVRDLVKLLNKDTTAEVV